MQILIQLMVFIRPFYSKSIQKLLMINQISTVNSSFNLNQLISMEFIDAYYLANGSSIIQDFSILFKLSPKKLTAKKMIQLSLKEKLQKITRLRQRDQKLLFSSKKTDQSKLLKTLIMKNNKSSQHIQDIRTNAIKAIRKNQDIPNQDIDLLIFSMQIFGIQISGIDLQTQRGKTCFKKALTSLRKMIGDPEKRLANVQTERRKAYLLNVDFKIVLQEILKSIQNEEVVNELQQILEKTKNKKWLGSRFDKQLLSQFWTSDYLYIVYKSLCHTKINQKAISSSLKALNKMLKKVKTNLKKLIQKKKKNETYSNENTKQVDQKVLQSDNQKNEQELSLIDKFSEKIEIESFEKGISLLQFLCPSISQEYGMKLLDQHIF